MTGKKLFGYIFLVIAAMLTLAIVGQLQTIVAVIFGIFKALSGRLDAERVGEVFGMLIYWVFHIGITILFWKTGRRWIKKNESDTEQNNGKPLGNTETR